MQSITLETEKKANFLLDVEQDNRQNNTRKKQIDKTWRQVAYRCNIKIKPDTSFGK